MPRLRAGLAALRRLLLRLYRRMRLDLWFPQIPLGLAVGRRG
ncbi:hypothetical protein GT370_02015 [Acidocella sp. MX-AZ03]|nr:hypothetical protein [Acidocella sp. MX-AZ03]WBO59716.1 hypothetical protein GT370_02015 [Acidocella sp. MX-AZ03]